MIIPDLPWRWILGPLAALVLILLVTRWRRRRDGYGGHRPRSGHRHRSSHGSESGAGSGYGMQSPEQKALLQAANEVRTALDKQGREMVELRTFWSQRFDELSGRIAELARGQGQGRENADRVTRTDAYAAPPDGGMYGAESLGWPSAPAEPAWSPGPGDQPVEVRDGALVASRSLPPAGYLSAGGAGPARLYLNADVQLTEYSLPKWAAFFELQGARPYAAYRTRRPAEVRWDEGTGRGELIRKGEVEAI